MVWALLTRMDRPEQDPVLAVNVTIIVTLRLIIYPTYFKKKETDIICLIYEKKMCFKKPKPPTFLAVISITVILM
jgi:hypothetical protein